MSEVVFAVCLQISNSLRLHSIKDRSWHIQACSAKTGEGVQVSIYLFYLILFICFILLALLTDNMLQ